MSKSVSFVLQVKYVAEKIDLPEPEVEKKLSQMILDKKFQGILDQETRVLIIFEESERDETYDNVLETISAMSKVVDRLYQAAQKLTWTSVCTEQTEPKRKGLWFNDSFSLWKLASFFLCLT